MKQNSNLLTSSLISHFSQIPDPRCNHARRHLLSDIIVIAVCAVICGANNWVEVALFGRQKQKWFEDVLELPHGIPSHDTFSRVFAMLNPEYFESSFRSWTAALSKACEGRLINVDGKTVRLSYDRTLGKNAIHMVSAWAGENRLVLAQTKVEAKTNEITAIPQLLDVIDIANAIVTIDALGCQQTIAETIARRGADYILAVKNNQKRLHQDIAALFGAPPFSNHDFDMTQEKSHGRKEIRYCSVIADPELLSSVRDKAKWANLKSVIRVTCVRQVGKAKKSVCSRYYISSLDNAGAKETLKAVRGHWGVENSLHWILDVAFREDQNRIRKDHGPENFSVLRRIALNLLKRDDKIKAGIKAKRLVAGWNNDYLLELLLGRV